MKRINFTTAKLAKEAGYNVECKHWYDQTETLNPCKGIRGAMIYTNEGYAPYQAELQEWLRNEHNIHVEASLEMCVLNSCVYVVRVTGLNENKEFGTERLQFITGFKSYEDALEEGFVQALKILLK